jgi:hypothetical protein
LRHALIDEALLALKLGLDAHREHFENEAAAHDARNLRPHPEQLNSGSKFTISGSLDCVAGRAAATGEYFI